MDIIINIGIGAFIGYFTNYLAIKMIFSPYKAYHFFGKKIPFTPGLIFLRKKDLADKIGEVVENDLIQKEKVKNITVDNINEYLKHKGVNDSSILNFLTTISENILGKFIERLNIKKIVHDEIIDLDTKKLEEVITQVSSKELAYLQYLGGLLGAFIGSIQYFINI